MPQPASNPNAAGFSRPVTQALEKLTRAVEKLQATMQRSTTGGAQGAMPTAPGGGSATSGKGKSSWWEIMGGARWQGESAEGRREARGRAWAGVAGSVGALAVSGITTGLNPMLTSQEKQAQFAQSAGSVLGTGIGGALGAFAGPMGAMIGSQIGGQIGSSLGGLFGQQDQQVMQEAKQGFGDLRELAKAGYKISDEMMAKRATFEVGAAQRGYEFDKRTAGALSTAGAEQGQPGKMAEILDKLGTALLGLVNLPAGIAKMVNDSKVAKADVEARRD